jgi:hypothetical protein
MKKYKVTQEFMDALEEWNNSHKYPDGTTLINQHTLNDFQEYVTEWLFETGTTLSERNGRYGAIINWINGEDVFKVGNPKYIVQRKEAGLSGVHQYLNLGKNRNVRLFYGLAHATRFDDFEKASEWANKYFEVVEVDE